jgi:hypothetical protein
LLAIIADPKAAAKTLSDVKALAVAREADAKQREAADAEFAARTAKREGELAVLAAKLEEREADHYKAVAAKETELAAREKRLGELHAKAEADAEKAAQLRAEMQRWLKVMEGAA